MDELNWHPSLRIGPFGHNNSCERWWSTVVSRFIDTKQCGRSASDPWTEWMELWSRSGTATTPTVPRSEWIQSREIDWASWIGHRWKASRTIGTATSQRCGTTGWNDISFEKWTQYHWQSLEKREQNTPRTIVDFSYLFKKKKNSEQMRYYITYLLSLFGWVHDLCGIESEASDYFYSIIECSIVHV